MKEGTNARLRSLILSAVSLSFTLFFFGPVEFLLSHKQDFWFNVGDVIVPLALVFALAAALMTAVGLPAKKLFAVLPALYLALSLMAYVQCNYINADYGSFDGTPILWGNYTVYGTVTTIVWVIVLTAAVVLAVLRQKWVLNAIPLVAICLLLIQSVTIGSVVLMDALSDGQEEQQKGGYTITSEGLLSFSKKNNVIVFVADAFDAEYMNKLLNDSAELFDDWTGFSYYPDFVGSYSKTPLSVTNLMTGQWYHNEMPYMAFMRQTGEDIPFLNALAEEGYAMGFYSTQPAQPLVQNAVQAEHFDNIIAGDKELLPGDLPGLLVDLYRLDFFRYFPHYLKKPFTIVWDTFDKHGSLRSGEEIYDPDNFVIMDKMAEGITLNEAEGTFRYIHVTGAHFPADMNEAGQSVRAETVTPLQKAEGVIGYFTDFLNQLKEAGLYEDALIIFTADHGKFNEGVVFPVFCLKLPGQTGQLTLDDRPLCSSDIPAILIEYLGLAAEPAGPSNPLTNDAVYDRVRSFYSYTGDAVTTMPDLVEYAVARGQTLWRTGVTYQGETGIEEVEDPSRAGSLFEDSALLTAVQSGMDEDGWSVGNYTQFSLPLTEDLGKEAITVRIRLSNWREGQRVVVSAYGQELAEIPYTGEQADEITFTYPVSLLTEDNRALFKLYYPDLPFEVRDYGDTRRVCLQFERIDVVAL